MNFGEKLYTVAAAAMTIATGIHLYEAYFSFRATERASQVSEEYHSLRRRIQQAQDESLSDRIREHQALEKCTQFILHGCTDNTIEKFMKSEGGR